MKQRVRVIGIIRSEDGILVLKRSTGRSDAPAFWELPTGKIRFGEQPEESLARSLIEYIGLNITSARLCDAITFLTPSGASRVGNLYIIYEVSVDDSSKIELSDRYTAYKFIKESSKNSLRMDEASMAVFEIINEKIATSRLSPRNTIYAAKVYVDGASRGNPGPSGIGYNIIDGDGNQIECDGEFIGFATSRVAEYYAMKKGIERTLELGIKNARFYSDSLMVINQLNGIFKVKNRDILPIFNDIESELKKFEAVSFVHIPRTSNPIADREANLAIDRILKPSALSE
ncbi:MAG: reverse transcriptase-like protein [Candidatus Saccharibacteria bacterium]|nr:reverse transcriptase-like protein [Candidatus Saccharibacteria bacterium]